VVVYTVDRLTRSFADFSKPDLLRKSGEACFPFFELGGAEEVERQVPPDRIVEAVNIAGNGGDPADSCPRRGDPGEHRSPAA
jgi:hypothetical protein